MQTHMVLFVWKARWNATIFGCDKSVVGRKKNLRWFFKTYMIELTPDRDLSLEAFDDRIVAFSDFGEVEYLACHLLVCLDVHGQLYDGK